MESNVEECNKLEMEGGRFQILLCANKTELINKTECDMEEMYMSPSTKQSKIPFEKAEN